MVSNCLERLKDLCLTWSETTSSGIHETAIHSRAESLRTRKIVCIHSAVFPTETKPEEWNRHDRIERHNLDALIRIHLAYGVVMYGHRSVVANAPKYLRKENICNPTPLQLATTCG